MMYVRSALALSATVVFVSLAAHAQATRTWISGVGDDANPCSRTAPCKTWAGAISKTSAGGEIDALDPGGFGALTITKAITLDGGGNLASILVAGTNGIVVSAGIGDQVTLRNLAFQGLSLTGSGGLNGVLLNSAGALHIDHCKIMSFTQNGISIAPTTQPALGTQVYIEDTTVQDNQQNGLYIIAAGTNVHVSVSNSRFTNNGQAGINSADYTRTTIRNSDASGNVSQGYLALANAGTVTMSIGDSTTANNGGNGVQAGGGTATSTIRVEHVTLFSNAIGFSSLSNGTIESFGNNYNGNPGAPTSTIAPQ